MNIRSVESLLRVYDHVEIQVRNLENLGIDPTMYGPDLLYKLPDELNLLIDRCCDIRAVLNEYCQV